MKNLIVLLLFISFSQIGCGQKAPGNDASLNNNPPITESNKEKVTAQNYIQKEIKFINPSSQGLEYYFSASQKQCFYEILINDVPVFRHFDESGVITPICLNPYITKSGKQSFTYRLYPQKNNGDGVSFDHLTDDTKIKIELFGRKEDDRINAFKNQKSVFNHKSATKSDGKTFIAAGKDYYESTISFEAEVPYNLQGVENSEDLSQMDQKMLFSKTVEAYRYYWKLINEKKMDDYFRLGFKSDVEEINSSNITKENLEAIEDADKFHFLMPGFKLTPMENYQMRLYAHGKVVCLEQRSDNVRLKNRTPIWGQGQSPSGEISTKFYKLYLQIPKGKKTFEILYKNARFNSFEDAL